MRKLVAGLVVVLAGGAVPGLAQVDARTATRDEVRAVEAGPDQAKVETQMESPMLLEFPLRSVDGLPVSVWMTKSKANIWTSREVRRFVCDRARVERVMFEHGKPKKGFVPITLSARISSEWFRQDIDVTISLIGLDGKEVAKKIWDDETFGNDTGLSFGGRSKTLEVEAKVPVAEWERWAAAEGFPKIKLLLDIQSGDSED